MFHDEFLPIFSVRLLATNMNEKGKEFDRIMMIHQTSNTFINK